MERTAMKKRILFVMTDALPMPPVKGGAVQHLVEQFLIYNEINEQFIIEVTSIPDLTAIDMADNYKNTIFKYCNIPERFMKLRNSKNRIVVALMRRVYRKIYFCFVKRILKNSRYDCIVFENELCIPNQVEYFENPKKYLHLHNDYINKNNKPKYSLSDKYDCILGISQFICDRVNEVDKNVKTRLLYNGLPVENFRKDIKSRIEVRKMYNIKETDIVFVFSGRMVEEKGLLELINAFNLLPKDIGEHAVLLIIGSKVYGNNISDKYGKEIRMQSDLSNYRIIFTGYIPHNRISNVYSACDIGCMPSLCEEALSLSVLEYMAEGLPIIISDGGGMVELCQNGEGIIVNRGKYFVEDFSKAMARLCYDQTFFSCCSLAAIKRAREFDSGEYCKRFSEILNEEMNINE
jgi:glycosyltransferase involved in cell wall biosynthesis